MDDDPVEQRRREIAKRVALGLGFDDRQADRLLFWRWLARRRGEVSQRECRLRRAVSSISDPEGGIMDEAKPAVR
jgi:hypothetical protein